MWLAYFPYLPEPEDIRPSGTNPGRIYVTDAGKVVLEELPRHRA